MERFGRFVSCIGRLMWNRSKVLGLTHWRGKFSFGKKGIHRFYVGSFTSLIINAKYSSVGKRLINGGVLNEFDDTDELSVPWHFILCD